MLASEFLRLIHNLPDPDDLEESDLNGPSSDSIDDEPRFYYQFDWADGTSYWTRSRTNSFLNAFGTLFTESN